jgi:hypothetical protein
VNNESGAVVVFKGSRDKQHVQDDFQPLTYRELVRDASRGALGLDLVVEKALETGYVAPVIPEDGDIEAPIMLGTLSGACFLGTFLVCVTPTAPAVVTVGIVLGAYFGLLGLCSVLCPSERKPSYIRDFKRAARKLTAVTAKLPDGPAKQSLQAFSHEAARTFIFGYAATLQGRETLRKKGLRLMEKAATKMKWTDTREVEAALCQGQLPTASMLAAQLSHEHRKLQETLLHSTRVGQPKPLTSRCPRQRSLNVDAAV